MNGQAPGAAPRARGDTISRNAVFAFATQMSTAAFTAALTAFLTRKLGPANYGTLALALSVTGLIARPAAGGTSQAAARFVAERHGDTARIVGVLGMALRTRFLTAAGIAVALFALAGPISDLYHVPEMVWPLRGAAIAFFGQSLMTFGRSIFIALRWASGGFTLVVSESAMEFSATVTLVLLGGGVTGAAFGRAVGYVFGGLLGIVMIGRFLGRSPLFGTGPSPVGRREFVNYAGVMLIVSTAGAAFSSMDALLIGAFLSTAAVGIYSAPLRLTAFLAYPGQALAQGVAPRMARHPDDPPNVDALTRGLRYMVIVQAGLVAFLLVWAEPVVRLALGSQFLDSAEVLRALAPYVFLSGLSTMVVLPLNYAGEGRRRIPIAIATVGLGAAVDVVLIPKIGILGAAVGTDVAYTLYVGGHMWLSHRLLGLSLRPLMATTVRSFAAAGAMATILALFGTGELSALEWVGGLVVGSVAFVAVLLATRELSLREVRDLSSIPLKALRGG
jgi:O-antigen/teichoic acid export membrane protein